MTNYTIKALNFHRKTGESEKEKNFSSDLKRLPPPATNSSLFLISAVQALPNNSLSYPNLIEI